MSSLEFQIKNCEDSLQLSIEEYSYRLANRDYEYLRQMELVYSTYRSIERNVPNVSITPGVYENIVGFFQEKYYPDIDKWKNHWTTTFYFLLNILIFA